MDNSLKVINLKYPNQFVYLKTDQGNKKVPRKLPKKVPRKVLFNV